MHKGISRSLALALVAVLVVASIAIVYFSESSIKYSLYWYSYQKIGNQWHTIESHNDSNASYPETFTRIDCQNNGLFEGTFTIIVSLTNASFSEHSFQPPQLINSSTVKLSYTLNGLEKNYTNVYFTINSSATRFVISIAFQTNQLFMRHTEANWAGQSEFTYITLGNELFVTSFNLIRLHNICPRS